MLIVRIPKQNAIFIRKVAARFHKNMRQGLVLGDIAYSTSSAYLIVHDEALSVAFAYSIYLKAKDRDLRVDPIYAIPVNLDKILPDEVKEVGKHWLAKRPSKNEIESLKNKFIIPDILEVLTS